MALPLYLALTAPELSDGAFLPERTAYMACHFSLSNAGLSNFPTSMPAGAMLIVNDSIPPDGHDPGWIAVQLAQAVNRLGCSYVLLDLQKEDNPLTAQIAEETVASLPCPVIVSECYAYGLECPVFLSAPPADRMLAEYVTPWTGRDIWLEIAPDARTVTVDKNGSHTAPCALCSPSRLPHWSEALQCSYRTELSAEHILFTLQRAGDGLKSLLRSAEALGIVGAVGLYQELGAEFDCN